jgi:hypothetical protein
MTGQFPQPTSPDEVLANIRDARAELEAAFAGLPEETLTGPATDGGWTIKDHLSHIAEWQRRALAVFEGKHPCEGFRIDQETFDSFADVHELNAYLYQRNRDRSLSDVIEDFRATHQLVESRVASMSHDDLHQELTGPVAARFPRVVDLVNFNIARHDRSHIGDIRGLARN